MSLYTLHITFVIWFVSAFYHFNSISAAKICTANSPFLVKIAHSLCLPHAVRCSSQVRLLLSSTTIAYIFSVIVVLFIPCLPLCFLPSVHMLPALHITFVFWSVFKRFVFNIYPLQYSALLILLKAYRHPFHFRSLHVAVLRVLILLFFFVYPYSLLWLLHCCYLRVFHQAFHLHMPLLLLTLYFRLFICVLISTRYPLQYSNCQFSVSIPSLLRSLQHAVRYSSGPCLFSGFIHSFHYDCCNCHIPCLPSGLSVHMLLRFITFRIFGLFCVSFTGIGLAVVPALSIC